MNFRSVLAVPLLSDGAPVGAICVLCPNAGEFPPHQKTLLQTFADQAVIAIQNAKLFNETQEALERQTATAEILKVIASSPADTQPIFDAIVQSAVRLCNGVYCAGLQVKDDLIHLVANHNWVGNGFVVAQRLFPMPLDTDHVTARAIAENRIIHLQDMQSSADVPATSRELAIASGYKTLLVVPMLQNGRAIGAIAVAKAEGPFSDREMALLATFADQAVIAIQNVRLFHDTRVALERQTATAEVLQVISRSPTDVQPVLDAVARRAAELCDADWDTVWLATGPVLRMAAYALRAAERSPQGDPGSLEMPLQATTPSARAAATGAVVHVPDVVPLLDTEYPDARAMQARFGFRTVLAVPMVRDGACLGAIGLNRRDVRPFRPTRSRWCRHSPTRRSSPSRTHGCSTRRRLHWSDRRRPPTSCASSANPPPT